MSCSRRGTTEGDTNPTAPTQGPSQQSGNGQATVSVSAPRTSVDALLRGRGLLTASEFLGMLLLLMADRCVRACVCVCVCVLSLAPHVVTFSCLCFCMPCVLWLEHASLCLLAPCCRHPTYAGQPSLLLRLLCKRHLWRLPLSTLRPTPWLLTRASDPDLMLQVSNLQTHTHTHLGEHEIGHKQRVKRVREVHLPERVGVRTYVCVCVCVCVCHRWTVVPSASLFISATCT